MYKRNKCKIINENLKNNSGSISEQSADSFPKIIKSEKVGGNNEKTLMDLCVSGRQVQIYELVCYVVTWQLLPGIRGSAATSKII